MRTVPAAQFCDLATVARYDDEAAVRQFARSIDVLTFEFENIPSETIGWASENQIVRPRGEILLIAQNRLREKEYLSGAGFPVAPFRRIAQLSDLTQAADEIGRPAILKNRPPLATTAKVSRKSKRTPIWARPGRIGAHDVCVLEGMVDFEKEISVLVARGPDGSTAVLPVCENIHRNHILDLTLAPARIEAKVAQSACQLAMAVAKSLDLVGLLAVEMFLKSDGELIINELAPRPAQLWPLVDRRLCHEPV